MHRWRYVPIVLLLFQLVCFQSHASEKGSGKVGQKSLECDVVGQALAGKRVRVHTQDQSEIEGRLAECVNDTLYVANDSGKYAVSLDAVGALWVRGTMTKRGLVTGGIIGGVVGGVLGVVVAASDVNFCDHCDEDPNPLLDVLYIAGLVAVPGALIGTGIGAISHRWNLWYASEAYSPDFSGLYRLDGLDNRYKETARLRLGLCCVDEGKAVGLRVTIAF